MLKCQARQKLKEKFMSILLLNLGAPKSEGVLNQRWPMVEDRQSMKK